MTDDPHGSLAARVLTAIERHPEGLPLEDLRERLRRNGRRPAAEAVAAALLDLQRADLAHIGARRRWFPYHPPPPPASSRLCGALWYSLSGSSVINHRSNHD